MEITVQWINEQVIRALFYSRYFFKPVIAFLQVGGDITIIREVQNVISTISTIHFLSFVRTGENQIPHCRRFRRRRSTCRIIETENFRQFLLSIHRIIESTIFQYHITDSPFHVHQLVTNINQCTIRYRNLFQLIDIFSEINHSISVRTNFGYDTVINRNIRHEHTTSIANTYKRTFYVLYSTSCK